jgi:hypothetical protein
LLSVAGNTNTDRNISKFFMDTPRDSIGVLWAYFIIYVMINTGVWGLLFWPIYRPLSPHTRNTERTSQIEYSPQPQRGRGWGGGQLSHRAAPQFLWDLKGLNRSSARAAFRWAVFMRSFAGLPPVFSF